MSGDASMRLSAVASLANPAGGVLAGIAGGKISIRADETLRVSIHLTGGQARGGVWMGRV